MFSSCFTLLSIILLILSSFKSVLSLIIFSDDVASFSPTKNLLPLICRYRPNHLSIGWLWNLDVMMKSYPSTSKSFLSKAWYFKVLTNAEAVCEVKVNLLQLGTLFLGNSESNLPWLLRTKVFYLQLQLNFLDKFQLNTEFWN